MAIVVSDPHLRSDTPVSRLDDYLEAQERKWAFLLELAAESPPLIVVGDLLHRSRPQHSTVAMIIRTVKEAGVKVLVVPGQHDLPDHRLARYMEGGLGPLVEDGAVEVVVEEWIRIGGLGAWAYFCPFGCDPPSNPKRVAGPQEEGDGPAILFWHRLVIDEKLWPGQRDPEAREIVERYGPEGAGFSLIFTGDNHQTVEWGERPFQARLLNSGSMMRMRSDQADHQPIAYRLTNPDGLMVERIELPIEPAESVLSREHLERQENLHQMMDEVEGAIAKGSGLAGTHPHRDDATTEFLPLLKAEMIDRKLPQGQVDLLWHCHTVGKEGY